MADLFQHPVVQALAWTLIHFLWQGAAIAAMASVLMKATRGSTSRYAIGVAALFSMLIAPVVTFLVLTSNPLVVDSLNAATAIGVPVATELTAAASDVASTLAAPSLLLGSLVIMWMTGVMFFGLRLAGGWMVARRVTQQAVRPASAAVQRLAERVAEQIGLRRAISVLESSLVSVPVLVGWLKPVIVLPAAALAALSPDQVEALIAHELAHVRRHDFLVNLLQSAVEAVLFYHPAVWWLSRRVRAEREHCCDDVAVGVCDRLVYATALKDLAAMASPRLALAATDGDLLSRIRRVLSHGDAPTSGGARVIPLVVAALVVAGLAVPAAFVVGAPRDQREQNTAAEQERRVLREEQVQRERAVEVDKAAQSAQSQRQSEEIRREVEKLLKELEERLRQVQSPADLEKMRALVERQLMATSQERDVLADRGRAEEMARAKRSIDDARLQLERGRAELERGLPEALDRAKRLLEDASVARNRESAEGAKQQLEAAEKEMARARSLFERGLMSQSQLQEAEKKMKELGSNRELDSMFRELVNRAQEDQKAKEAFGLRLKDQQAVEQDIKRRFEDRMKEVEAESKAKQQDLTRRIAERKSAEATRLREVTPEDLTRNVASRQPVTGPVQGGDLLQVTISGEPDFPTSYQVRSDGTIRVPFLGAFKVVGQSAEQVQAAIGKQLAERRLGSANQVKVTVFRTVRR